MSTASTGRRPVNPATQEEGSILLLGLGFFTLAALLLIVTMSISTVHVQKQRLWALADTVAANAAEALGTTTYYEDFVPTQGLPITREAAWAAVGQQIEKLEPAQVTPWQELHVQNVEVQGNTLSISLSAKAQLPLVPDMLESWLGGVTLQVRANSVSVPN